MADPVLSESKRCNQCGEEKPLGKFPPAAYPGKRRPRCYSCVRVYQKRYRQTEKGRAHEREYMRKWKMVNHSHNSHYSKKWQLKKLYGLTMEQYAAMIEQQNGLCAVCGRKPDQLNIDHCHETGRLRGLLCNPCNLGIGQLGDTIEALERALTYLRKADT